MRAFCLREPFDSANHKTHSLHSSICNPNRQSHTATSWIIIVAVIKSIAKHDEIVLKSHRNAATVIVLHPITKRKNHIINKKVAKKNKTQSGTACKHKNGGKQTPKKKHTSMHPTLLNENACVIQLIANLSSICVSHLLILGISISRNF